MTPDETIRLCRSVKALCPSQALDQYSPDAWQLVLGHLDYNDAKQAVGDLASLDLEPGKARYIEPGHIIARVKAIRAKRLDDHPPVDPPSGLTPGEYLRWLRDTNAAIASGRILTTREAITGDQARTSALVASVMDALPAIESA